MYESFIVVFSGSLVGIIIGIIISTALSAQRNLYTMLPIRFIFPSTHIYVVLIVSFFCGIFSVIFPMSNSLKHSIGSQIKNLEN